MSKALVPDELWEVVEPLIPPEPSKPRAGKKGGAETRPNPTDRGKAGTKLHVLADRHGLPLSAMNGPANEHDSGWCEAMLDIVEPIRRPRGRRRARPDKLHADKAYEIPRCRADLRPRGIKDRIARKGIESSAKL